MPMLTPMDQSFPASPSTADVPTPATTAEAILNQYSLSNALGGSGFVSGGAEVSGFEVLVLAKEIDSTLRGSYVNNIYTGGASQIVRFRKPGGEEKWLVVSPKRGAWISSKVSERAETSEFTSRLRAELERARFLGASQIDLDRVFLLEFEGKEPRTLVVELMPPGNLVVTDPQGKIRLAMNEVKSGSRRILRGGVYSPPSQGRLSPAEAGPEQVAGMLREENTLGRALGRHVALPRKYVADALARVGARDSTPSAEMIGKEAEVSKVLKVMVELANASSQPCICEVQGGEELFAYHPICLKVTAIGKTMSELCDRLFLGEALAQVAPEDPEETKRKELAATASKLKEESDSLLARASGIREGAGAVRGLTLGDAIKKMKEAGLKPTREPTSPEGVSSFMFDFAKELEAKALAARETASRLEKRASKVGPKKPPRTKTLSKRRGEWFEKFRWFVTVEGRLAIGGRDAQSNAAVLGKHLDNDDTVYHADLFGSPFFVLKGGMNQSEKESLEVAQATVAFSSAWKTGLGSADAYWVKPDQVSAAAPSGEYLASGSYSIRGKKNFLTKIMVEVAVGVDREGRVAAGPEAAIRRNCDHYVVLKPHNEKSSETAKRVLRDLGSLGAAPPPTLEDVQRALPAGGGKILRRA
jgi:predicted ribosome quality control (RQC) complex YloA/Tae2 family protein